MELDLAQLHSISRHPGIKAEVITRSEFINNACKNDDRYRAPLISLLVTFPMSIHSQVNTHRAFSRNSASTRAINIELQCAQVEANPFVPHRVYKNGKGMHSVVLCSPDETLEFQHKYRQAAMRAVEQVRDMSSLNVHKQHLGRMLIPFAWQTVIITATEFENFIAQRVGHDAQPEISDLAYAMLIAMSPYDTYNNRTIIVDPNDPESVNAWHIPFYSLSPHRSNTDDLLETILASMAKCARVSYANHGLDTSREADRRLDTKLIKDHHLSPVEHIALSLPRQHSGRKTPSYMFNLTKELREFFGTPEFVNPSSNFSNDWLQLRKIVPYEHNAWAKA